MKIHIQCTDGDACSFDMSEENGMGLIESIRPSVFFNQPLLHIQAGRRTSIFNMAAVESIYFATTLKAKIREQPLVKDFRTISEADYREKMEILHREYESLENLFERGHTITTLLAIQCRSRKEHFLQVNVTAGLPVEQLMDVHNRLKRITSVIPCSPDGYIAINPSAIKRIEIYPAPQETMLAAWLVD